MAEIATRFAALLLLLTAASTTAAQPQAGFPPPYYAEAMRFGGKPLDIIHGERTNAADRAVLASVDGRRRVAIERSGCAAAACDALFERRLAATNAALAPLRGAFVAIGPFGFAARWEEAARRHVLAVERLPDAVVGWQISTPATAPVDAAAFVAAVARATDRHRAELAGALDPVEFARWSPSIHRHARDLLAAGRRDAALAELGRVVAAAPANLEAQLDLAENTGDATAARTSAAIVWETAEAAALAKRAARLLGHREAELADLPVVAPPPPGLRVFVVPLAPVDPRLVASAARLYADSVGIPVTLARLPAPWHWGEPDRFVRQREVQAFLLQRAGRPIDFAGWSLDRYRREVEAASAADDPRTRFQTDAFMTALAEQPGQFRVDRHLEALHAALAPLRGDDRRTMVVAVTEADIFAGQANFMFSGGSIGAAGGASILSYAWMRAERLGEPTQSRTRLVQRLAKEMVPATLNQLGIVRPADPADPHSYADSVARVDQKTLTLSAPTRAALDRLRGP
ncbi:MAG: hypothetical protein JNK67_04935 [Alphaproteobacteria bacterium]|nr:hypothetical protein [Alphaproteobacteria bacterium]